MPEQSDHVVRTEKRLAGFPVFLALRTLSLVNDRQQARLGAVRGVELDARVFLGAQKLPGLVLVLDR